MIGQSVGSDASRLSCYLFRPRKRLEKHRKALHKTPTQHAQSLTISAVIFILTVPFQSCFGHSPTNGSHSLSLPKAGIHAPPRQQNRTQRLTGANRGCFRARLHGGRKGWRIGLGTKRLGPAMTRCSSLSPARVAAAPLGCAVLFVIWRCCLFFALCTGASGLLCCFCDCVDLKNRPALGFTTAIYH